MNDGGQAFPYSALTPEGPQMYGDAKGMTLRQYYAAASLKGVCANPKCVLAVDLDASELEEVAKFALKLADAMIKVEGAP